MPGKGRLRAVGAASALALTLGLAVGGNRPSALERLLAWKLDLTHVDPLGLTALTSAGSANGRYPAGRRIAAHHPRAPLDLLHRLPG